MLRSLLTLLLVFVVVELLGLFVFAQTGGLTGVELAGLVTLGFLAVAVLARPVRAHFENSKSRPVGTSARP